MRKPIRRVRTPASRKVATTKTTRSVKSTSSSAKSRSSTKGFERGEAGFKKAAQKREQQQEDYERMKNTPFDFRLKPGEEAEVVILDRDEPFFTTLHKVKGANGRWEDAVCIADTGEACPLCSSTGKEGSYTMILTILDKRPYKIKNGPNAGKTIKASRKLFMVKGRNLPKFERQFKRRGGKWRGLRVNCARSGEKEAAIGEDLEFRGVIKEAVLAKYGEESVPAPYEEIFPIPTAKELASRYRISNTVSGSSEFDEEEDDGNLDKVKW